VAVRGETHHASTLTLNQASAIKQRIANGEGVSRVASEIGIPYQIVYRLAKGKTWPQAQPDGDVLGERGPGPSRCLALKTMYALWKRKRDGHPCSQLAKATKLSESTVRRACAEFELLLAHRVSKLHLTSGGYELAAKRYGLAPDEARSMDEFSRTSPLTPRLKARLENELPALEKHLNGRSK
jgi:hypothetical protein